MRFFLLASVLVGCIAMKERVDGMMEYRSLTRAFQGSQMRRRKLQDVGNKTIQDLNTLPCNAILGTLSLQAIKDGISAELGEFASALFTSLKYDVQVRKICASCGDVVDYRTDDNADEFDSFCEDDVYGSNATYSGLMILPLNLVEQGTTINDEDRSLLPGTLKTVLLMRPTVVALVPTITWELFGEMDTFLLLQTLFSARGYFTLLPDLMGYGESTPQGIFKSYIVRTGYVTSTMPLWWKARDMIRNETGCTTSLGDGVGIVGYSEGGYSSIVMADAMTKLGINVLDVRSGAGPLKVGSQAITRFVQGIDEGTLPTRRRYIVALIGVSLSSTYSGLLNYQQNQDLLASDRREEIIDLAQSSLTDDDMNDQIPSENYLDFLINPVHLAFARSAVANGNFDPCNTLPESDLKSQNVDLFCDTLQQLDLISTVQSATYPLEICHSPDDEVVSFANAPDFETLGNNNVTYRPAMGTHNDAAVSCLLAAILYYLGSDFDSIDISNDTQCNETLPGLPLSPISAPVGSPIQAPVAAPVAEPTSGATAMALDAMRLGILIFLHLGITFIALF